MTKNKVIETLEQLPNEFSTEELIDRLLFVEKIEQGLNEVKEGKVISLATSKERFSAKWK